MAEVTERRATAVDAVAAVLQEYADVFAPCYCDNDDCVDEDCPEKGTPMLGAWVFSAEWTDLNTGQTHSMSARPPGTTRATAAGLSLFQVRHFGG